MHDPLTRENTKIEKGDILFFQNLTPGTLFSMQIIRDREKEEERFLLRKEGEDDSKMLIPGDMNTISVFVACLVINTSGNTEKEFLPKESSKTKKFFRVI